MEQNIIYRKPDCPFGNKAIHLLRQRNIEFQERVLETDAEIEEVKSRYQVRTTPQIILDGEHVGGYSELAQKLGEETKETTSYVPVIAVFSVAALLALSTTSGLMGFMGYSLSLLATLKLKNCPISMGLPRASFAR